jgi:hypothetical protein
MADAAAAQVRAAATQAPRRARGLRRAVQPLRRARPGPRRLRRPCAAPQRAAAAALPLTPAAHAAQPGERWTLWVKLKDGGDYVKLSGFDPEDYVHDLKVRWLSEKRDDALSLFRLSLVKRGSGTPDAREEAQAAVLESHLTLREAGITDRSVLLVDFAGGSTEAPGARRVTRASAACRAAIVFWRLVRKTRQQGNPRICARLGSAPGGHL